MKRGRPMVVMLSTGMFLAGVAGWALAQHQNGESVKVLSSREIVEKLDGQAAKVTVVEVTIAPGESGLPHRHPGPGFVYVAEGEYELGIDQKPVQKFKAGETFYEPTGCLHRVSRNPSQKTTTRLIAFVLHPRTTDEIAVPEKHGIDSKKESSSSTTDSRRSVR